MPTSCNISLAVHKACGHACSLYSSLQMTLASVHRTIAKINFICAASHLGRHAWLGLNEKNIGGGGGWVCGGVI